MRGTRKRFWIEIVVLGTAIACAVGLLVATLGAAAGAAAGDPEPPQAATQRPSSAPPITQQALPPQAVAQQQTYEGMVTCSRCGAKHSPVIAKSASDCVLVCVHGGAQFALIDGNSVYILEGDPEGLKKVAGERARITGAINGNTINVSSVGPGN